MIKSTHGGRRDNRKRSSTDRRGDARPQSGPVPDLVATAKRIGEQVQRHGERLDYEVLNELSLTLRGVLGIITAELTHRADQEDDDAA